MEYKGFGSNAHVWARLKNRDLLRTYLTIMVRLKFQVCLPPDLMQAYVGIAANLKMSTPQPVENFEYDPTKTYVYWPVSPFFKPWNNPTNITAARDMIAKHLSENNLHLRDYVDHYELTQVNSVRGINESEEWRDWGNARSENARRPRRNVFTKPTDPSDYRFQRRAIRQLDTLPMAHNARPCGILKNGYRIINEPEEVDVAPVVSQTSSTSVMSDDDFENIEDPRVKYKSSWQGSRYVTEATARYNLRSRIPALSAEPDDIWSDSGFDDTIA